MPTTALPQVTDLRIRELLGSNTTGTTPESAAAAADTVARTGAAAAHDSGGHGGGAADAGAGAAAGATAASQPETFCGEFVKLHINAKHAETFEPQRHMRLTIVPTSIVGAAGGRLSHPNAALVLREPLLLDAPRWRTAIQTDVRMFVRCDELDDHVPYGAIAAVEERKSTLIVTSLPDLPFEDIVTQLQAGPGAFWFVDLHIDFDHETIKIGRCEFASWPSPSLALTDVSRHALVKYLRTLDPVELTEDDVVIPEDKDGLLDEHALPSLPVDDPVARLGGDDDEGDVEGACVTVLLVAGSASPDETTRQQIATLMTIARTSFVRTHVFANLADALPHAPGASVIMLMPDAIEKLVLEHGSPGASADWLDVQLEDCSRQVTSYLPRLPHRPLT